MERKGPAEAVRGVTTGSGIRGRKTEELEGKGWNGEDV